MHFEFNIFVSPFTLCREYQMHMLYVPVLIWIVADDQKLKYKDVSLNVPCERGWKKIITHKRRIEQCDSDAHILKRVLSVFRCMHYTQAPERLCCVLANVTSITWNCVQIYVIFSISTKYLCKRSSFALKHLLHKKYTSTQARHARNTG